MTNPELFGRGLCYYSAVEHYEDGTRDVWHLHYIHLGQEHVYLVADMSEVHDEGYAPDQSWKLDPEWLKTEWWQEVQDCPDKTHV